MIDIIAVDLNNNGINEVILAAGNLSDQIALSIVYLDENKHFILCPDFLVGTRMAYLDSNKRIVLPDMDNKESSRYQFIEGRLVYTDT